jgi:hypothetical protein
MAILFLVYFKYFYTQILRCYVFWGRESNHPLKKSGVAAAMYEFAF